MANQFEGLKEKAMEINMIEIDNKITHEGVVSNISDSTISVLLKGNINCEGCKAKSACGVSDANGKIVEVQKTEQSFKLHEPVSVLLDKNLGVQAVLLAYLLPFVLLIATLIISSFFVSEWLSGLLSIIILVPYFTILHYANQSIKKKFKISIVKNI